IDLWLQVASVKALGFSSTTLKIPEALAGTAAVPLLYACVRRLWGVAAALGIAFDVKLLESVVALPALAVIACLGLPSPPGRRLAQLAGAGAVYVVVALSSLTA